MKILRSWLNDFGRFDMDSDTLSSAMTSLGLAVESIIDVDCPVKGVVVAKVLRTERHPSAEKVQRVYVEIGDGVELHIWCGAFNFAAGDHVPLATIGTTMPDGRVITKRGILGIESHGMLCSGVELGISQDSDGILILPTTTKLGNDLFGELKISQDVVFDLDITRNRPDCNGYLGVARDLGAKLGVATKSPKGDTKKRGPSRKIDVKIVDQQRCGRYNVTVMSGVLVTNSPDWIVRRLTNSGMRPINNVVDASNLLMLELNQPTHAFDADKVHNGFRIRVASEGEQLVTLDAQSRSLSVEDLLICDGRDQPIALAGVMGGMATEIGRSTTTVALETAWFEGSGIGKTAARLSLRSEASMRFERGVDPHGIDAVVSRFAAVLRESCPDLVVHGGPADVATKALPSKTTTVGVRVAQVNRILGTKLTANQISKLLIKIGFSTKPTSTTNPTILKIAIPSWRPDCNSEIDLVEEIARHVGYEQLGKVVSQSPIHGKLSPSQNRRRELRQLLLELGVSQAMPNPFLAPGDLANCGLVEEFAIRLANPLIAEESILRTSLRPGLLKAINYNLSHRNTDIALFELGHVYCARQDQVDDQLPYEFESLCLVMVGATSQLAMDWWSQISAAMNFGAQLDQQSVQPGFHATRTATIRRGKQVLGSVGEIDPVVLSHLGIAGSVACLELNLSILLTDSPRANVAKPVSRFPRSDFDLAFSLPNSQTVGDLLKALRQAGGSELVDISLFDVYRSATLSENSRSVTFRLCLQATDRTLTIAEVTAIRLKCLAAANKLGALLRD